MAPPQWAYKIEHFINEPDEELICSICCAVFCNPVMCPCYHVFCQGCIRKWLLMQSCNHKNCPICHKEISFSSIKHVVPIINNLVMKLQLNCHNKTLGCKAQFSLKNSETHIKECEYELSVRINNMIIPNSDISADEIRTKLKELLERNAENEDIFDWIDAKISPSAVCEPAFIRILTQEVHKASIPDVGGKYEFDQFTLKQKLPLLTRYIDHNELLELQALYALQSLMNDLNQPKGVLWKIFDLLYDDDVITEETFKLWEQSKDPAELEGKGVALMSVRGFFTLLREADSGEDLDDE